MKTLATKLTPISLALALVLLGACSKQPDDMPPEKMPGEQAPAPETPTAATPTAEISSTSLKITTADPRVKNWDGVGELKDGKLTSNATSGYLMFGPKVPFDAGKYMVTIKGHVASIGDGNHIKFDATSQSGKQVHGLTRLESLSNIKDDIIANFEIDIQEPIQDLEIRAFVTSGVSISISAYEVTPIL